jgi:hypothetical protein
MKLEPFAIVMLCTPDSDVVDAKAQASRVLRHGREQSAPFSPLVKPDAPVFRRPVAVVHFENIVLSARILRPLWPLSLFEAFP